MKLLIKLLCLLTLICLSACNSNNNHIPYTNWRSLTIIDDHRIIYKVNNDDDSSTIVVRHIGGIFAPLKNKKSNDTLKVYFTKSEKDTLAYLTKDLILHPAKIRLRCSEFSGTIELAIDYGQFKQYGMYDSVCNWVSLSDKTQKLNNILQLKIKKLKIKEE